MTTTTTSGVAAESAAEAPAKAHRRRGVRGRTLSFWLFTGPFLVGLTVFVYIPIGWSAYLSFFEARYTVTPSTFVGFDNYSYMLTNDRFTESLVTFTVFAAFIVPVTWAFSLGLALLVNRLRFMRAFFRSVFFLPTAVSFVAASLIWKMSVFSGVRFGLMNTALGCLVIVK
ncbi:carbohydrate ABC transporter permease, partial [Streptomyces sp. NPDC057757]|uniref:carbohydrate ABC transporter permease n=1 Tax=Streptomyces sp. NPDC057757 TaxID=3346241 RepID=UPI0036BE7DE2